MKKIKVELTPEELAMLIHIIGEKEKEVQQLSHSKNISLGIIEKLTAGLTGSQKEATINEQVKAAISRLTGVPAVQIKNTDALVKDLQMTSQQIHSLSISFSYIAGKYKPGVIISGDDCEAQDTIQDCVGLIISKIG